MNGVDPFDQLLFEVLSGARGVAIAALITAVPASLIVLAVFRRRVLRSITPKASLISKTPQTQQSAPAVPNQTARPPIEWHRLNQAALSHRAGLARVYILGGIGLAAALAFVDAIMNVGQRSFSPLQFLLAAICFSTPLALCVRLIYGRWKPAFALVGFQIAAVLLLTRLVPPMHDDAAGTAVTVSLLLMVLLHPRMRAMGALATGFFTVVFTGALVSVGGSIFLMRDSIQANILADPRAAALIHSVQAKDQVNARAASFILGSDASFWRDQGLFLLQTIAVLALVGILASLVLGSLLFFQVTRSYARKRLSDQWLVIASIWLFLATAVASVLSPLGVWANLACVAVFGFVVAAGWRRVPRYEGPGVRLLLLRSFTLGERSNRLFQDLESLWRSIGSIQLVGAVDVAVTTLEPHELLDFLRGRFGREFVHREADVDARLASFDHARDPDGRDLLRRRHDLEVRRQPDADRFRLRPYGLEGILAPPRRMRVRDPIPRGIRPPIPDCVSGR
jgi:hypothetical protein